MFQKYLVHAMRSTFFSDCIKGTNMVQFPSFFAVFVEIPLWVTYLPIYLTHVYC